MSKPSVPRVGVGSLRAGGILAGDDLRAQVTEKRQRPALVEGMIQRGSVNVLVGDPTIGKTPLLVQLGLCIAFEKPFLGRTVQRGTCLYLVGEGGDADFLSLLDTLVRFLGETAIPDTFQYWSPWWSDSHVSNLRAEALGKAKYASADLTIVDTMRSFFPKAETKVEAMNGMIEDLRGVVKHTGGAVMTSHHRRKAATGIHRDKLLTLRHNLVESPEDWLESTSGVKGLIGNSDLRLGMDTVSVPGGHRGDIVLCGKTRYSDGGRFGPLYVERVLDDDSGEPQGYQLVEGASLLSGNYKAVFEKLPTKAFGFREVRALLGNSSSNTVRFLQACMNAGIVGKSGTKYMRFDLEESAPSPAVDQSKI